MLKPREYIAAIEATGEAVAERETIDRALEIGETLMLGLRLIDEGLDRTQFAARFGVELDAVYGSIVARLVEQGLIEDLPDRIRLTARGRLMGNRVFAEYLQILVSILRKLFVFRRSLRETNLFNLTVPAFGQTRAAR